MNEPTNEAEWAAQLPEYYRQYLLADSGNRTTMPWLVVITHGKGLLTSVYKNRQALAALMRFEGFTEHQINMTVGMYFNAKHYLKFRKEKTND